MTQSRSSLAQGLISNKVCPNQKENFFKFIEGADKEDAYILHLEKCHPCGEAVRAVFEWDMAAFKRFGDALRGSQFGKRWRKQTWKALVVIGILWFLFILVAIYTSLPKK